MSELRVDSVKSKGGGAPDLPKGVTISGITTAATLGATTVDVSNVNVSGVVTSATLNGPLLSTGTPTLGLGVTINSSGVAISGVATAGIVSATTLYGDGTNITGVGATIAPLFYNPDINDATVSVSVSGIGVTFNSQVKAGSGNVTLRIAGAAGTVVENFGVGNSATVSENRLHFTPTSNLDQNETYFVQIPGTALTNNEGTAYVGTGYTFNTEYTFYQLFGWGLNQHASLGNNSPAQSKSSPVQVPGNTWNKLKEPYTYSGNYSQMSVIKTDGTLWSWGYNKYGTLGQNNRTYYSSPVQIPGTTWSTVDNGDNIWGIKTDGTLWGLGTNWFGRLGQNEDQDNDTHSYSSPVQVPGTTWKQVSGGNSWTGAVKTDGTLWMWGYQNFGQLGLNKGGLGTGARRSSPVQVPGTTWSQIASTPYAYFCTRTDGTLWAWGQNTHGILGQNNPEHRSSPVQIPGTTWASVYGGRTLASAIKTDGTLWAWGLSAKGQLCGAYNNFGSNTTTVSSPIQIPGTTWQHVSWSYDSAYATKTDGTVWVWGDNTYGTLGLNSRTQYSSPVQLPGSWSALRGTGGINAQGIKSVSG